MISPCVTNKTIRDILLGQNVEPLTRKQILLVIDNEISKPESEMNTDLIDACTNILLKMDSIDVEDIPEFEKPIPFFEGKKRKKKWISFFNRKPVRGLVAACITFIIILTVNTISASAFNFNFASGIVEWTKKEITIFFDNGNTPNSSVVYSEILTDLQKAGFENVMLPTLDINGLIIEHIDNETTNSSIESYINLVSGSCSINIHISQCNSQPQLDGNLNVDYISGEEISYNGNTFYFFSNNKQNSFVFVNGNTRYCYTTTFDEDTTKEIIKSIQLKG